ncbi:MAG: HD domain-containing phosphohydrolase [Acidimicrobiales bacterium]
MGVVLVDRRHPFIDPLEHRQTTRRWLARWREARAEPGANRRLWRVTGLLVAMLLAHFVLDYLQNSGIVPIEGFASDALLVFPVIYASLDFGVFASLGTALAGTIVILGSELVVHDTSHELSAEWTILAIIVGIAIVLGLVQERMQDQREFLELATREASIAVWEYDVDGNSTRRSANHDQLFGLTWQRRWRLETFFATTHPDDRDRSAAAIERAMAPGGPDEYVFDVRAVHPDGTVRWMMVQGRVTVRDETGRGQFARGVLVDITARKDQEREIENLSMLYAALSECNQAVVYARDETDLFGRIVDGVVKVGVVDAAWVGLFDTLDTPPRPVAHAGPGVAEFLAERDEILAGSTARWPSVEAAQSGRIVALDVDPDSPDELSRVSTAHGWRSVVALPIRRRGAVVATMLLYLTEAGFSHESLRPLLEEMALDMSFALDLIEDNRLRELAQLELRDSEERFRAVVEQSVVGIYLMRDNHVVIANARAATLLGYESVAAMLATPAPRLDEFEDVSRRDDDGSFLVESDQERVIAVRRPGGEVAHLWLSLVPIVESEGLASLVVLDDVTAIFDRDETMSEHLREIETVLTSTVQMATSISELRDPYTAGHQGRVAAIAVAIGEEMGLDAARIEGLRMAGQLHDIGKIAIPAEILTRPGRLSDMERRLIEQHPRAGFEILQNVPFTTPVALVALQHHERLDGSGYPDGLRGDDISLEARIVAVADVLEAMSSHRPYRPSLGVAAAVDEIERGAGSSYDPVVADAALRLAQSGALPL